MKKYCIVLLFMGLFGACTGGDKNKQPVKNVFSDNRSMFKDPPLEYRMNKNTHNVPDGEANQDLLLDNYLMNGYGGLATNVNWTKDYMYNDKELASFFRFVNAAKFRGMDVWLYDEKIYPSGMAGTIILDKHPEWEA